MLARIVFLAFAARSKALNDFSQTLMQWYCHPLDPAKLTQPQRNTETDGNQHQTGWTDTTVSFGLQRPASIVVKASS